MIIDPQDTTLSFTRSNGGKIEIDFKTIADFVRGDVTVEGEGELKTKGPGFKLDLEGDLDFSGLPFEEGEFKLKLDFDPKDSEFDIKLDIEVDDLEIKLKGEFDAQEDTFAFDVSRQSDDGKSQFQGVVDVPQFDNAWEAANLAAMGIGELFTG